jgi:ribosomal protein S18 acetylase RimI-like enzyme
MIVAFVAQWRPFEAVPSSKADQLPVHLNSVKRRSGMMGQLPVLSEREFAALFENCRRYWLGYGNVDRANDGLTLYRSGLIHAQMNGVMWLGHDDVSAQIDQARRRLGGVPWRWWVGPDSNPGALHALVAQGGTRHGTCPVMAAEADRIELARPPSGFTVEQLDEASALPAWVQAFAPSMGFAPEDVAPTVAVLKARAESSGSLTRFAGHLDGKIVGTSELLVQNGVGGIYLVSTAEAYRRRGIGAAMTSAAVAHARHLGLRLVTLQASTAGRLLYCSMGFAEIATYEIVRMPVEHG